MDDPVLVAGLEFHIWKEINTRVFGGLANCQYIFRRQGNAAHPHARLLNYCLLKGVAVQFADEPRTKEVHLAWVSLVI